MRSMLLNCPLCCGNTFQSKEDLIEHMSIYLSDISCPICNKFINNLPALIKHISICKISVSEDNIQKSEVSYTFDGEVKLDQNTNNIRIEPTDPICEDDVSHGDEPVQNVQLLDDNSVSCLQNDDINLLEEVNQQRYMLISHDGTNLVKQENVVSKQNNDGTISFTSLQEEEDNKSEDDSIVLSLKDDKDTESKDEENEEIYSCNVCGVSFTSVYEHIQNYHNNEDVVVEVNETASEETIKRLQKNIQNMPIDFLAVQNENPSVSNDSTMTLKRVITESGNIIEAVSSVKLKPKLDNKKLANGSTEEKVFDKTGRVYTRKLVQVAKFWDKCPKQTKKNYTNVSTLVNVDDGTAMTHQVVVKEIKRVDTQEKARIYTCVKCNVNVMNLDELQYRPCKEYKYKCLHCPMGYDSSQSLCAHMKVHKVHKSKILKTGDTIDFTCDICFTNFPTNKSLRLHRRMHYPIKSQPIEPPVNTGTGDLTEDTKFFMCKVCDKSIPLGYKDVHDESHKTIIRYNCDICNKKFLSHEYLTMHMAVHNNDKITTNKSDKVLPYVCLYCNRQFARPHEKVKHERIHTGEKPHKCDICGKTFRVSYCLTIHMRTHTGARPYECQFCGKRFKAHSVYNHHLLTHSDVRAYKCPYCPKAFKTSVQLAGHKNSHTKPFACTQCNRRFASLYSVRVHTETHSRQNNLKYACPVCGATYARTFALKDHMKQIHMQDLDNTDNLITLATGEGDVSTLKITDVGTITCSLNSQEKPMTVVESEFNTAETDADCSLPV